MQLTMILRFQLILKHPVFEKLPDCMPMNDRASYYQALVAHEKVLRTGVKDGSDEYFTALDEAMGFNAKEGKVDKKDVDDVVVDTKTEQPKPSAPPRVARRRASRGVMSAGPWSQPNGSKALPTRASSMAWRASFSRCAASLLALPSTPKPIGTPASSILRRGKMPLANRMLLHGQWAMPVRVLANR